MNNKNPTLPLSTASFSKEGSQWRKLLRMFMHTGAGTIVRLQITNGTNTVTYTWTTPEPDANYGVVALPAYNATCYLSARSATAFTLTFSVNAGASSFVDIITFRS